MPFSERLRQDMISRYRCLASEQETLLRVLNPELILDPHMRERLQEMHRRLAQILGRHIGRTEPALLISVPSLLQNDIMCIIGRYRWMMAGLFGHA